MKIFYLLAIQGFGVAEVTDGECLYSDYREAEKKLQWYRDNKMDYMRIFYLYLQDADAVALDQSKVLSEVGAAEFV
jgi:hypothetical protein